jgi:hypothetical protein
MRYIYLVLVIYCLIAAAGTLKGLSILNNSGARMERIYQSAGFSSQHVGYFEPTKGCAK